MVNRNQTVFSCHNVQRASGKPGLSGAAACADSYGRSSAGSASRSENGTPRGLLRPPDPQRTPPITGTPQGSAAGNNPHEAPQPRHRAAPGGRSAAAANPAPGPGLRRRQSAHAGRTGRPRGTGRPAGPAPAAQRCRRHLRPGRAGRSGGGRGRR